MSALAEHVPTFLHALVLSPHEQAASAANGADVVPRMSEVPPIRAEAPDGSLYGGDLVADVVRYRELRARSLAGDLLAGHELDELSKLESDLRQPRPQRSDEVDDAAALRSFFRFACDFPARVRAGIVDAEFSVKDISAGGVKLEGPHRFTPGDVAALTVAHDGGHLSFPSRVAWVRGEAFGLMFAGAARPVAG